MQFSHEVLSFFPGFSLTLTDRSPVISSTMEMDSASASSFLGAMEQEVRLNRDFQRDRVRHNVWQCATVTHYFPLHLENGCSLRLAL